MTQHCIHFGKCGGCQHLDIQYDKQLQLKQKKLSLLFSGYAGITIPPVVPSSKPLFYRHKVQLPFAPGRKGTVNLGCYATDSHTVVDQNECCIQDKDLSAVAWAVRAWASECHLEPYNEVRHSGFLRHLLLRKGAGTGEILIGLITNGDQHAGSRNMSARLLNKVEPLLKKTGSRVVGIVQNVNTRRTNVVLGQTEYCWWGRPFLFEKLGAFSFKFGLSTFFQVNPYQTPNLYNEVLHWVPEKARVLDIYCGVGSITLWVSSKAAEVLGIEENVQSVKVARDTARHNKVAHAAFESGDAAEAVPPLTKKEFTTAIVDPPRKGLDKRVIDALRGSAMERIIYVSCNPESLVKDIESFKGAFKLLSVKGFDMFPHTDHVETVAVLQRC